ncbi:MAG: GNAT family N-acetyltransferase [Actinomycetota bacterium]|nr:GNAT family N-acetyltransferase [Actinomycetota bacterium]
MEALLEDEDVLRFTRIPVPVPPEFARSWLDRYEDGRRDGTREAFAIADAVSGAFLGLALAPRIEGAERTVELGYIVSAEARGRGVATAALGLLTAWAFSELGALRIELFISVDNGGSKRVAERCGYTREGVLRSTYFKQGLREDTEIWSRLPSDPEPAAQPLS